MTVDLDIMQPMYSPSAAPPSKKQRAGGTPQNDRVGDSVTAALSSRRAQLAALQKASGSSSTSALMERARAQLSQRPTATPMRGRPAAPPPPVPEQEGLNRRRSSDIFPGVAKLAAETKAAPPPPPVARRLELDASRSKSAPPSRPAPPSAPPRAQEAPPVAGPPPKKAPPTKKAPPPPRPSPAPPVLVPETTAALPSSGPPPAPPKSPSASGSAAPPTKARPQPPQRGGPAPKDASGQAPPKATSSGPPPMMSSKEATNEGPPLSMGGPPKGPAASGPPLTGGPPKGPASSTGPPPTGGPPKSTAATTGPPPSTGGPPTSSPPLTSTTAPPLNPPFSPGQNKLLSPAEEAKATVNVGFFPPFNASGSTPTTQKPLTTFVPTPETTKTVAETPEMTTKTPVATPYLPTTVAPESQARTTMAGYTPFAYKKDPIAANDGDKTPPIQNKGSVDLRLSMELSSAEKAKTQALRRVAELEEALAEARHIELRNLLQVAETKGDKLALDYVRKQVASRGSFVSPLTSQPRGPLRRRSSLPRPKHQPQQLAPELLKQATERVEHEYVTDLATFTVRRPYGVAEERDLWMAAGQLVSKLYGKQATASQVSSIEVAATIAADGTIMAVYGEGQARHQTAKGDWEDFGAVYERDAPLGSVSYIDNNAVESEYSLDEIFEGAMAVREHYCSTILSTAAGLKLHASMQSAPPSLGGPPKKVGTVEIGVDTKDLPQPPSAEPKKKKKAPEPEPQSDVMSVAVNMFASGLFNLLWGIFIGFPIKVLTTTLALAVAVLILGMAWVYLADDHGAGSMGAGIHYYYNPPGIM